MKFSFEWLKQHLDTAVSAQEIANKLTLLGLEVESLHDPLEKLSNFKVALVEEIKPHPNADRLKICTVNCGNKEKLQIVCGASNVHAGMKAVLATEGVIIPETGQVLKNSVIRGVESFGMLCSAAELCLDLRSSEGILELPENSPVGVSISKVLNLGGPVFDLAITPNRSDCFGVKGIARDLAAAGLGTLKHLIKPNIKTTFDFPIKITTEEQGIYFSACIIKGVKNCPSPDWLQQLLLSAGVNPISALVDMTTFFAIDTCRPLHVYDADTFKGPLVIRKAKENEIFNGLKEKTFQLNSNTNVLADDEGILCALGILGGGRSKCAENTSTVMLESAWFNPIDIAKAGQAIGLINDSRTRFERGVDPNYVIKGLENAAKLITEICGGEISHKFVLGEQPKINNSIFFSKEKLNKVSGVSFHGDEPAKILYDLGFIIESETNHGWNLKIPSWRPDIKIEEDLIEEILRIKGYDSVPVKKLPYLNKLVKKPQTFIEIKKALCAAGCYEVITYPFMRANYAENNNVIIKNPINTEFSVLRSSLFPGLLEIVKENLAKNEDSISLFEMGPIFSHPNNQELIISGVRSGNFLQAHWLNKERSVDAFDAKADVLFALNSIGITHEQLHEKHEALNWYHPGRSSGLYYRNNLIAFFGEIHPFFLKNIDIKKPTIGFEIFLKNINEINTDKPEYQTKTFQSVIRDFAFIVNENITAYSLIKSVKEVDNNLIKTVNVFDVFTGGNLEINKKSIAIRVKIEPTDATLTDSQINDLSSKIIKNVFEKTKGELRL